MNSKTYEREVDRVSSTSTRNDFIQRYGGLKKVLIYVIYPLTGLIIGALMVTHLYVNFQNFIAIPAVSFMIALSIAFLLEVGKYHFSDAAFDGLRAGDYEDEDRRGAFFLAALGTVCFVGMCLYFDWKGAPVIAEYVKKQTAPPTLVDIDVINADYDSRIAIEEEQSKRAAKMTWKGAIITDGRKLLEKTQQNKDRIEAQREEAIASAREANMLALADFEDEHQTSGFWMRGIILLATIAQIICLWFVAIYNDTAPAELKSSGGSPPGGGKGKIKRLQPVATEFDDDLEDHDAPAGPSSDAIVRAIKNAEANLRAWQNKLNAGIGRPGTAQRQIEYWKTVIASYEKQLSNPHSKTV